MDGGVDVWTHGSTAELNRLAPVMVGGTKCLLHLQKGVGGSIYFLALHHILWRISSVTGDDFIYFCGCVFFLFVFCFYDLAMRN